MKSFCLFFVIVVIILVGSESSPRIKSQLNHLSHRIDNVLNAMDEGVSLEEENKENTHWIVVTSIQGPTESIRAMAAQSNWTVVVVGDKKSPPAENYQVRHVVYLSVEEQEKLGYQIKLPYNSYSRKNIGYLYAIQHGARVIYESDDDNELISDLSGFLKKQENILHYTLPPSSVYPLVNPYSHFGHPSIWPRGYPLDAIEADQQEEWYIPGAANTWIQQSLANGDPDVDAIFRLTRKLPHQEIRITFDSLKPSVALPQGIFCPYNSQNTLHHYEAFWALYLPSSVSFRVSDIWRSYWAQRLLWEVSGVVTFLPPFVYQTRNAHDYLKDFIDEQQLYSQSGKLVTFLQHWQPRLTRNIKFPDVIMQLTQDMQVNSFWGEEDVQLIDAWVKELTRLGYQFPPLKKALPLENKPIHLEAIQEEHQKTVGVSYVELEENKGVDYREKTYLFICILVAPDQLNLRDVVRQTYLTYLADLPEGTVSYKFFTDYSNNEQQVKLLEEEGKYGDLHISSAMHCHHHGGHCHNSLNLVTDALSWTVKRYDFQYFLRLDSDGYLCLPQLLKTLENRPKMGYIAGYFGCKLGKVNTFFRADEAFLLFTQDIARMYTHYLHLFRRNPYTTFALNFGAATLALNITMEDWPWGPSIPEICANFVFIHKQKDPADIRSSHKQATNYLSANGVHETIYKPLCKEERVDKGQTEAAVTDKFWGRFYVDYRRHWLGSK